MRLKLLLLLVLLGSALGSRASTFVVNSTADGAPNGCTAVAVGNGCTLREAVTLANEQRNSGAPDAITFDPAVFNSAKVVSLSYSSSSTLELMDDVEIIGPAPRVTVRQAGRGRTLDVFFVWPSVKATMSNLVVANGLRGINSSGSLTLSNCSLRNNADYGLFNEGTVTATDCLIDANDEGIANVGGTLTLTGCIVQQNLFNGLSNADGGIATLTNCTIRNNSTGVANSTSGTMDIVGSTFSANGFGVFNTQSGKLAVNKCDFRGNSYGVVNGSGGAATVARCTFAEGVAGVMTYPDGDSRTTVTACILKNNYAAFYNYTTLTATECTMRNNEYGVVNEGTLKVTDCTIWQGSVAIHNLGKATVTNTEMVGCSQWAVANFHTMRVGHCFLNYNNIGIKNMARLSVDNCSFIHNGAGLNNEPDFFNDRVAVESNLNNCTLSDNDIAIGSYVGRVNVRGCTLYANDYGIDCQDSVMAVTNCTIHSSQSAGIASYTGKWTVTNCTISRNLYGILHTGGKSGNTIRNTLVVGNDFNISGDITYGGHNIISGTAQEAGLEVDEFGRPLLKDNGGPTPTVAVVTRGTAANKGANALIPRGTATDQRGVDPVHSYARIKGGIVDIGAFESDFSGATLRVGDAWNAEGNASGAPGASLGTLPGTVSFAVMLSAPATQTVTVHYATSDGAPGRAPDGSPTVATAGSDYLATSGTLTFAPGETSKTVQVRFIGDAIPEADEAFSLILSVPSNAVIADSRGVATIVNDDGPGISIDDAPTIAEGDPAPNGNLRTRPQVFTVRLSAPSTSKVTVDWATAHNTAGSSDYFASIGTLTFAPGQTSKLIVIQVKGDTDVEPTESYRVNLSHPTLAVLTDSQAAGFITDDDTAPLPADEPSE